MVQLTLPNPKASKREKLLALLQTGKRLSKKDIWRELGIWNSGDQVMKLRRSGINIVTEMVEKGDVVYAEYFIPKG